MSQSHNWKTVTLILPAGTPLGLPAGKWHRLRSGEVKAIYTRDELEAALTASRARLGGKWTEHLFENNGG